MKWNLYHNNTARVRFDGDRAEAIARARTILGDASAIVVAETNDTITVNAAEAYVVIVQSLVAMEHARPRGRPRGPAR